MIRNRFFTSIAGVFCCLTGFLFFPVSSIAHYASITVDNYNPAPGEPVTVAIGFGHAFPADGEMRRAAYDHTALKIIGPTGGVRRIAVKPSGERGNAPIQITFEESGVHTLVLIKKNFSSKTTKGYRYEARSKLTGVLNSKWSETTSKALVMVDGARKKFQSAETDARFQMVPLKNPADLSVNDYLPVKITLDGKPWRGMAYATYAGFSDKSDTFAYTTRTDKEGIAEIRILEKGVWLVKADHTYPYENKADADEYALTSTLTFNN